MNSSVASDEKQSAKKQSSPAYVVLTGNPNCGKTTLFNALTGLRAKVGNYAGVTVERKEGRLLRAPADANIRVLDLPGTYSLSPNSLDEQISRDVLLNRLPELSPPDLIVIVVDASNLQRNLYYATQVVELGHPTLIALNMVDVAEENGHRLDEKKLSEMLGAPVLPIVASTGHGVPELRAKIVAFIQNPPAMKPQQFCQLPGLFRIEATGLANLLAETFQERRLQATAEALLILSNENALASSSSHYPQRIQEAVTAARKRLDAHKIDWRGAPIEWRYARVAEMQSMVTTEIAPPSETLSDKLDCVLTHKVWGLLIFVGIMALLFQSIFTFAKWPMDLLTNVVDAIGGWVGALLPPGDLNTLLVAGVIKGVGAVIVFLPQILLLFLFISILEDTGYMARAAFLMDRLMSKVGLHGKSFIPMLSSFACAIPGIMATRTIESPKDRLVTILVAPLMSCSARLPVYAVLIAACIPDIRVFGFWKLSGITMLSMYLLGIVVALLMAWLFKKTLLKGPTPMLIMELPPYKRPLLRVVLRHMWDRSKLFLRRAGTVILGINILLWFLATYPRDSALAARFENQRIQLLKPFSPQIKTAHDVQEMTRQLRAAKNFNEHTALFRYLGGAAGLELYAPRDFRKLSGLEFIHFVEEDRLVGELDAVDKEEAGERLRRSLAGRLGRMIEPAIAPLGFDWKMGIGIVASFAAREVFVSTMSTVYNVGEYDKSAAATSSLAKTLQEQKHPDGTPIYTPLVAVTLMIFYVFALQCVSTVAIVLRETNSWKWPAFQWLYMGLLAWSIAFITYHGGRFFGWN
jgi:ferrous iron transport protein B